MGLTIHLFNSRMQLRKVITKGISELIHNERNWTLTAEIPSAAEVKPGEYLGFRCVDGRFRLFEIDNADDDQSTQKCWIVATDASVGDLVGTMVIEADLQDAGASETVNAVMSGSGWEVNYTASASITRTERYYYRTAWEALTAVADDFLVRVTPYYRINNNGEIVAKVLDVTDRVATFRGRLIEKGRENSSVVVSYKTRPRPKVYPLGASTGQNDPPKRITIENVEWSTTKGDPVDKPKGQRWIADPQALAEYGDQGQRYEAEWITDENELARKAWQFAQKAAKPQIIVTAVLCDMEMIKGQTWKAVRMWDLAMVRTKSGLLVETTIIKIERNYVRPWDTKITTGTEEAPDPDASRQIAALQKTAASAARTIASHGSRISSNTTFLHDIDYRVDENKTTIGEVSINLDAANARIDLMATREELSEVDRTLSEVAIALDAAEAEILLRATRTEFLEVEERVSSAEVRIDGAEAEIELKVSKNGVISSINQTPESVTINASKINLSGYVTASQLAAELADFELAWSDTVATRVLSVSRQAGIAALTLGGDDVGKDEITVMTGHSIRLTKAQVTISGIIYNFVTGVVLDKDTETIKYLSY